MKRFLMTALIAIFLLMVSSTLGQTPSTSPPAHDQPERPGPANRPGGLIPVEEGMLSPTELPEGITEAIRTPEFKCFKITDSGPSTHPTPGNISGIFCIGAVSYDCIVTQWNIMKDQMIEDYGTDLDDWPCGITYKYICYDLKDFEDLCTCDEDGTQSGEFCVRVWYTWGDDTTVCDELLQRITAIPCP